MSAVVILLSTGNRYGTRLLQKVDVPVINNEECEKWHRTRGINLKIFPEMMCAGYEDGRKDACVVSWLGRDLDIIHANLLAISCRVSVTRFGRLFRMFPPVCGPLMVRRTALKSLRQPTLVG